MGFGFAMAWAALAGACGGGSLAEGQPASTDELASSLYESLPPLVTVDVGTLRDVIEAEKTKGSCDRHFSRLDPATGKFDPSRVADPAQAQRDLILCGKFLFFNLPVASDVAVPENLLNALQDVFPQVTGRAMTKLGLRENPDEPGMPLEMPRIPGSKSGPVALLTGKVRTLTCVACHVGTLPDGRYSVGMPNDQLDLGTFSLLSQYPLWLAGTRRDRSDSTKWTEQSQQFFNELHDASKGVFNPSRTLLDLADTLGFLGHGRVIYDISGQDPVPLTDQRTFFKAKRGRLNPSSPMLSEPKVEIYASTPPIFQMAHREGSPLGEPYLGRVTSSRSLEEFIRQAYVYTTLKTEYSTPKWVDPIAAYLRTLEIPKGAAVFAPGATPDAPAVQSAGNAIFKRDCASCHDGLRGATSASHPLDAAGTPKNFDQLFIDYAPPTRQSVTALAALMKVGMLPLVRTGIKSRRFDLIGARTRLGYNGAIEGLDHLLCLEGRTRTNLDRSDPLADSVHAELCTAYAEPDRRALRAFLRQF